MLILIYLTGVFIIHSQQGQKNSTKIQLGKVISLLEKSDRMEKSWWDRSYNKMREKNRNNLKIEAQKTHNKESIIKASLHRHHLQGETNRSILSNDYSINDYTPITHTDKQTEYRKALQLSESNQKPEAIKILNRILEQLASNSRIKRTQFVLMLNALLNLWKIESELQETSPLIVERLRNNIPAILEIQRNFSELGEKIKNRINLLLIIYIKEEFQIGEIEKSLQLSKEFYQRIWDHCFSDDIKFKLRFIRIKIFNKLGKKREELQEITACENLVKNFNTKDQNLEIERKNKQLLKTKLYNRKKELKEELKRSSSSEQSRTNQPTPSGANFLKTNSKTLKLLNLESTANTNAFAKKQGRSFSLKKVKRSSSIAHSRVEYQKAWNNKSKSGQKNKSSGEGFLGLNSNQNGWNNKRSKGKTMHVGFSDKKSELNKKKTKPELQYKKLAKKTLVIKYKETDFKDLLSDLKNEQNTNTFQEMLLQRPFADKKQKNKSLSATGQVQNIYDNLPNLQKVEGNETNCEQACEAKLVEKKDQMIQQCIREIQEETLQRFYAYLQNRKNESEANASEIFIEEDSDLKSSMASQKKVAIQDHFFPTNNIQKAEFASSEKKFVCNNILLPYEQAFYKMRISLHQITRSGREKQCYIKVWLTNERKNFYYTFKMWKPRTGEAGLGDNSEKMENNNQELHESDKNVSSMELKSFEKEASFLKYFKDFWVLKMIRFAMEFDQKLKGKKNIAAKMEMEQDVNSFIQNYIEQKKNKSQLLLSKQSVRIFLQDKKSLDSIQSWYPVDNLYNGIQTEQKIEILDLNGEDRTIIRRELEGSPFKWKNKRTIYLAMDRWPKQNLQFPFQKSHKQKTPFPLQGIVKLENLQKSRWSKQNLTWIYFKACVISEYLMQNPISSLRQKHQNIVNSFYLAVKSFLLVDDANIQNIINLFFDMQHFTFVSALGKKEGSKNKIFRINIIYYEVKELYRPILKDFPIFMKLKLEEKNVKTQTHKFILTDKDLRVMLCPYQISVFQRISKEKKKENEENETKIFEIFRAIIEKVYIYKKITYSHAGVATESDKLNHIYKANKQQYIDNEHLLKPPQFLSPHLASIHVVYQGPIKIQCDKSYGVITVLKVRETQSFDLRIYVPKYQRIYSFSFCHEIFQYLNKKELEDIFSPPSENGIKNSRNAHRVPVTLEGIKNSLYSENVEKSKVLWSKIIRIFKFYRKFNAQRSYLIVQISEYEAFTKDCAICEYFTVKNSSVFAGKEEIIEQEDSESEKSIQPNFKKESECIIRVQVSMQMNKSGLNFLPKMGVHKKRKQRSVKTIFAQRNMSHNVSEQNSGESSKTYHQSLQNIYESETNKFIIYLSFIDTLTSQKIVYSYFLCELVHLLEASMKPKAENGEEQEGKYPANSIFFKEKTLNHATLWRILSYVKNLYQLKLQSQPSLYMPNLFKSKQLMDLLKRDVDCQLLKNKKSQKISLNLQIFPHFKKREVKGQKIERTKTCPKGKVVKQKGKQRKRTRISLMPQNLLYKWQESQSEDEKRVEQEGVENILFLHKKILLMPQRSNPISCIIYDTAQKCLKIYINNYKKAKIKELEIDCDEHCIPNIQKGSCSLANILKAMRKRLYRYHQNLMMLM